VADIRANTPADTVSAAPIRPSATTTRLRRSEVFGAVEIEQARVDLRRIVAAPPPVPPIPPGPFGDLSRASIDEIAGTTRAAWEQRSVEAARKRSTATRLLLQDLAGFTGDTWQQRWAAAGLGVGIDGLRQFTAGMTAKGAQQRRAGLRALFCLRVVRPSLIALFATPLIGYCEVFQAAQKDPLLDEFIDYVDTSAETDHDRLEARTDIPAALTAFGISMDALTPEALLHYAQEYRRTPRAGGAQPHPHRYGASAAWRHLRRMGFFGDDVPDTVRHCTMIGRRSVPELVRRYPLRNKKVEHLLITYLEQRAVTLDYSSLVTLSHHLADLFWSNIERINPEQGDLRLHQATYAQWKAMIALTKDGRPRRDVATVLMSVRGFYLDLQHWAHGEPERWAYWAVPCPIRQTDVKQRSLTETRRASERVAERTRQRQPLLGLLMNHVDERHQHATDLLAAALAVAPGEEFSHAGRRYQRTTTNYDRRLERITGISPARVRDLNTNEILNTADYEERTFWEWAVISTLRHSGVRVEELAELTHLSVRQYQRPNGEVVPLLVVAPSKTDRERVIPMSTELFATIAAIIRRHLRDNDTVPAVKRFDPHEQLWGEPLPHLFQRKIGSRRAVMSTMAIAQLISDRCEDLATVHPSFAGITFTPHDFRRLFATEVVNNGLPIHIGAALLGHLNIETTRGYVAVFNEDLVRHYQAFLDRRRAQRPSDEYRAATDAEWTEFEQHFDQRKVELGNCGRPYGTPCHHEHACVRCPMLHVDPKMLSRLNDLETDLLTRLERAHTEGWLGEIEGINLTLSFLRDKRTRAQRLTTRAHLGLPARRSN